MIFKLCKIALDCNLYHFPAFGLFFGCCVLLDGFPVHWALARVRRFGYLIFHLCTFFFTKQAGRQRWYLNPHEIDQFPKKHRKPKKFQHANRSGKRQYGPTPLRENRNSTCFWLGKVPLVTYPLHYLYSQKLQKLKCRVARACRVLWLFSSRVRHGLLDFSSSALALFC